MKRISIFIAFVVIILGIIGYLYFNYKAEYNSTKISNYNYNIYLNKEIVGSELTTIINKAVDSNIQNNVEKDNKGIFIDNNKNSISIEIRITDDDKTYKMETFANNDIKKFVDYYGNIHFKCTDIKYHKSTNKIKYMLFEQMTE